MSTTTRMSAAEQASLMLNSLPAYVEADCTLSMGHDDMPKAFRLMVRDRPTWDADGGRRCTCLTTGTEWFITTAMLEGMEMMFLDIVSFDNRNNEPLWRIS